MTPVATPGVAALAAALTPRTNYAARSAQRQEGIQIGAVLAAEEEKKAQEAQLGQAQTEAFLAQARSLPFLGRDRQLLVKQIDAEDKAVFQDLRDNYGGDLRKWKASGAADLWMGQAAHRLQNAPWYQQATENRKNVLAADEARKRGEYLVGGATATGYQTGEQQLANFLGGRSDSYNLAGSYKPTDGVKGIRDQYAPGRYSFERVQASPEEVYNHLVSTHGAEAGTDMFHRTYKNIPVFYKSASLEKAVEFQRDNLRFGMEQERMQMSRQDQAMQRQAFNSSERLKGKQGQLLDARITEKNGSGPGGVPYDHYLLSSPSEMVTLRHDPANPKQLSNGVDLGKVNKLAGVTLYGNGDDILARQLGLQRTRDGYRGHFNEAFTTDNGVNAINLKGVSYNILGVDSKAFYNPGDFSPGADRRSPLHGYARVTLQFSPYEAEKAGLYDPNRLPLVDKDKATSVFDSETRTGAGVYNPATGTATLYVPAGDLRNANFQKALERDEKGTKSANEDFTAPFMDTGF